MGRLQDRVAVVTGAGDGIGRGIARRFAAEGAKVMIGELDEASGAEVAAAIRAEMGAEAASVRTDVRVKEDVMRMIATTIDLWGTVDRSATSHR